MSNGIINRYEINDLIDPEQLIQISDNFHQHLNQNFQVKNLIKKYPVRFNYKGRLFKTIIDFVIESNQGIILIQNSGFSGKNTAGYKKKAKDLAAWFHLSKMAIHRIFQVKTVDTYLHFVLKNGLLPVQTILKKATTPSNI